MKQQDLKEIELITAQIIKNITVKANLNEHFDLNL